MNRPMKKWFQYLTLLIIALVATGCSAKNGDAPKTEDSSSGTQTTSTDSVQDMEKTFTLEELKAYNGKDGQPAYVAVDGIVYDVSAIPKWADGIHQGKYEAGNDLSEAIKSSPHGKSALDQAVIVGKLVE